MRGAKGGVKPCLKGFAYELFRGHGKSGGGHPDIRLGFLCRRPSFGFVLVADASWGIRSGWDRLYGAGETCPKGDETV